MLLQRQRKLSGGNLAAILKTAFGLVLMLNLVYPNISSTTMLNRCMGSAPEGLLLLLGDQTSHFSRESQFVVD